MNELLQHTRQLIRIGQGTVRTTPHSPQETGTVDPKGVRTIRMDKILERVFLDYIELAKIPVVVYSEDGGIIANPHPNPQYSADIDPLDGSLNYQLGEGLWPFGSFFTFFKGLKPRLRDVVVAGAIEYTRNLGFLYSEGQTTNLQDERILLKKDWEIGPHTPVCFETFRDGYEAYRPLGGKLFTRSQGAFVGHLSYLLTNAAAAIGGIGAKSEEIGAIYALVKGADGIVVDHRGKDIGDQRLDHEGQYQVLAGSRNVVNYAVRNLQG